MEEAPVHVRANPHRQEEPRAGLVPDRRIAKAGQVPLPGDGVRLTDLA